MRTVTRSASRLASLLERLDAFDKPIPLDELSEIVRRSGLTLADVRSHAIFGNRCYQRNIIHTGPAYQALALCWKSGQRSPIHDHHGSACVVRVLTGVATETIFDRSACGLIYATTTRRLQKGEVIGSQDADIHQMGNLEPAGVGLVTLHVYSPPLLHMQTFSLGNAIDGEQDAALRAAIRSDSRASRNGHAVQNGRRRAASRSKKTAVDSRR
ncbi:MAG: cysteine dioxygenase family protein [Phycisphaerae bacterium]